MRLRKKPWTEPELNSCSFYIDNPGEYKNKWNELFGNGLPVFLELGCGKGGFAAGYGAEHPDINYIAVDVKDTVLAYAKRKVEKIYAERARSTDNIKLVRQEIGLIQKMLGEQDKIDRIFINFCNPWPKPGDKTKRLTHPVLLEKYKVFLKRRAEIWFKTDDDELFSESQEYLITSGFSIKYVNYDLHNSDFKGNIETEHEKVFAGQGIRIKFLIAEMK